ncbi:hypothetical protein F901_02997 [Acinetobacter dispersus]|nr:hypothetical protein F901_02997 [Acinetobacter dispersus]
MGIKMLKEFTNWICKLMDSLESEFYVEVIQHENYFTKISLDSDKYISQITFWDNNNLYEAEVLFVISGETLFIQNGEAQESEIFSELFEKFFLAIEFDRF